MKRSSRIMRRLIAITLLTLAVVPLASQQYALAAPARPPVGQLRQDLQTILARPEYQQGDASALYDYVYRLWHAFRQWYNQHVARHFERLHDVSPAIYWTIVAVVAGVLIMLIYHLLLTLKSVFGGSHIAVQETSGHTDTIETDPLALLKQADAAAATGDFEGALRHLYLALIRNLDRHSLLRYDRSRTNQEYLREVRNVDEVATALEALTVRAEAVWYGERPIEPAYYAQCRDLALRAWQGEAGHAQL